MMKKILLTLVILSLAVSFASSVPNNTQATIAAGSAPVLPEATTAVNLLSNGYFDIGFYFRPTNHLVAYMWYEWWIGGEIPEFIDGGHPYHNQCYPVPLNGGLCANDNNHSQGYIRKGPPVVAGVYQPVAATVCTTYRFQAYNRNDDDTSKPRVGIEPTGWRNTQLNPAPPYDCPPTGSSQCPNPSLNSVPATIVWSPEFPHQAYTWASQSVTAEALTDMITVFTYVATPLGAPSISAYWDYASLVQVSSNNLLEASDTVPTPDGKITSVTATPLSTTASITWTVSQPARSQVYYRPRPTTPITTSFPNTMYFPIIGSQNEAVGGYRPGTPTMILSKNQSISLTGLQPETVYDFFVVSRWINGSSCTSSVSATNTFTTTTD